MPYVDNRGVRIHYEVEGEGPPLVLLHGLQGTLNDWRECGYVDALRGDYQLILIDARGHGESDKPHHTEAYRIAQRVGDITVVLDDFDISRTHFFGYSYGGRIGLEMAMWVPERIKSMIIGGMGPRIDQNIINQVRQILDAGPEAFIASLEEISPISADNMTRIMAIDYEAMAAILTSPILDLEEDLSGMTMPFLIYLGEADELYPSLEAKEIYGKLPDLNFFSLPGLDHLQSWSRSDLVLPHIKEFLARVSKS